MLISAGYTPPRPSMSSSTNFLLTSTPHPLPLTPSLNLLPFSLGPSSSASNSTTAPLSTYFRPRPAPSGILSVPEGTPIATFRGRQLVGHLISVPLDYRGVILGAGKRPDRGGVEIRSSNSGAAKEGQIPLTPASSAASVSWLPEEVGGVRRSPRKARGAGQVAHSRPKPRQPIRAVTNKRFRLDSESDDDDQGEDMEVDVKSKVTVVRTPSKRVKTTGMMGVSPVGRVGLPEIVVHAPTPLKPLPLSGPYLEEEGMVGEEEGGEDVVDAKEEEIVPSPATEEDPPTFAISPQTPPATAVRHPSDRQSPRYESPNGGVDEFDTSIRALRPMSSFEDFTLWTPDAQLAGFRADELETQDEPEVETEEEKTGVKVERGWWRTGGAGEGGDEVVRAMGEWLGLVEVVCCLLTTIRTLLIRDS